MLQDLQQSRKTEVDVINGGVVTGARSIGREAPLNVELTRIIHECEEGRSKTGPEAFVRLRKVSGDVDAR